MLVCYMDRKKVLKIQSDQKMSDVSFLELEFRKEFAFEANVNLVVTFQRFEPEGNETVDLDEAAVINNKDKLTALVTPILVTPPIISPAESPLEVGIHMHVHVPALFCYCVPYFVEVFCVFRVRYILRYAFLNYTSRQVFVELTPQRVP